MDQSKNSSVDLCDVHLHGWDSKAGFWHGPTPLTTGVRGSRATAAKIRNARGAFHGKLRCSVPGLPCIDFPTTVYDLMDIGLAIVDLDSAYRGPVGVVAVIPAARRAHLRAEFAFEFVTLLSFLGGLTKAGSELTIHDYIEDILRTASCTQIFTVETAELSPDVSIVLSAHFEHLSAAMMDWLCIKDSEEEDEASESDATAACAAA